MNHITVYAVLLPVFQNLHAFFSFCTPSSSLHVQSLYSAQYLFRARYKNMMKRREVSVLESTERKWLGVIEHPTIRSVWLAILCSIILVLFIFPIFSAHAADIELSRRVADLLGTSVMSSDVSYSSDSHLERILLIASRENPNISAAVERVNQSRADVRGAASAFGPTITGELGAQWNKEAQEVGGIPLSYRNAYSASLRFTQTVFSGGTLVANKRAAELALSATRAESVRTYQNVLNVVRVGYYDCRRSQAQLQVANENLNLSREHLKQTEALQLAGLVPMGDVLRVRVSVSQGELDRISAENALDVNWASLERAVGAALARDEILQPISGDGMYDLEPPHYTSPFNPAECALEQRAELKAYKHYRERAEQLARAAKGDYFPRVSLSGQTGATGDAFWPNRDDTWHVRMELQWTLFDSGEISSRVSGAQASARELLHLLDDLTSQVRQEVVQAELNLRSAKSRLSVAEDQILTAEEDYRIALRRYDAQAGTNLDVLDARAALTDSRTEYVNAVYDVAIAQSGLIYAMGDDLPPETLFHGGRVSMDALNDIGNGETGERLTIDGEGTFK